jgi:hypothetical protein
VQPYGTYQILRWGFSNATTLAQAQAKIDTAVANKEMVVILVHLATGTLNSAAQTILSQTMDYAMASAADVVTAREAFTTVGNLYESGDYPVGDYTVIDGQGKLLVSPALFSTGQPGDVGSRFVPNYFYGPHTASLTNAAPPLNTPHAFPFIVTAATGLTLTQVNLTVQQRRQDQNFASACTQTATACPAH